MISRRQTESILNTYSFEEILNWNELTEDDVLYFLLEQEFLEVPNPKPVDYDDE